MRACRMASGATIRGPLRRPDGSIDTGMPITSRRARFPAAGRGETTATAVTKRPKRPAVEVRSLMRSQSFDPDGPFGQGLRYGRAGRGVNAVIHEVRTTRFGAVHQSTRPVESLWTTAISHPSRT